MAALPSSDAEPPILRYSPISLESGDSSKRPRFRCQPPENEGVKTGITGLHRNYAFAVHADPDEPVTPDKRSNTRASFMVQQRRPVRLWLPTH